MGGTTSSFCQNLGSSGMGIDCCVPQNRKAMIISEDGVQIVQRKESAPHRGNASPSRRWSNGLQNENPQRRPSSSSISPERKDSQSRLHSLPTMDSSAASSKDPPPMEGWRGQDQRILLSELEAHPIAWKHPDHLRVLFERTHRLIPHKSLEDIEKCYKYLETKRIAFFSSKDSQVVTKHASFSRSSAAQA